eukprot:1159857-Pelagomonas_calceolata.AAC.10
MFNFLEVLGNMGGHKCPRQYFGMCDTGQLDLWQCMNLNFRLKQCSSDGPRGTHFGSAPRGVSVRVVLCSCHACTPHHAPVSPNGHLVANYRATCEEQVPVYNLPARPCAHESELFQSFSSLENPVLETEPSYSRNDSHFPELFSTSCMGADQLSVYGKRE